jgi:chemotaxis methyl-accepting protein methylase
MPSESGFETCIRLKSDPSTADIPIVFLSALDDVSDRAYFVADVSGHGASSSSIRIWSAACSTGQELYSIAIVLKELLGDPQHYGIRLVGTDISDAAISRASRGWYGAVEMSRGLPPELHSRYFLQHQDGWKIYQVRTS